MRTHIQQASDIERYEQFVQAFGPADALTDQQVAALTAYCSDVINVWAPTVAAELLRGAPWDDLDEDDELDETSPRVIRVTSGH